MRKFLSISCCAAAALILMNDSHESRADKADKAKNDVIAKLEKPVSVKFSRTPLQEAIAIIAKLSETDISLDGDSLKAEGYTKNMAQSAIVNKKPARIALHEVLKKYKLVLTVDRMTSKFLVTSTRAAKTRELEVVKLTNPPKQKATFSLTSKQIERIVTRSLDELKTGLKSPGVYRRSHLSFPEKLATIQLLATVTPSDGAMKWANRAGEIRSLCQQLLKSLKGRAGFDVINNGVEQLGQLTAGQGPNVKQVEVDLEANLPYLMKRMEVAIKHLTVASKAQELTGETLELARDHAAIMSLISSKLPTVEAYNGDDDWVKFAGELQTATSKMNDLASIKAGVLLAGQSCVRCHEGYR